MGYSFSTPEERARAAEDLGKGYNDAFLAWRKSQVVATVNGYDIVPVATGFGRLFQVDGTSMAFRTLEQATAHANKSNPKEG